MRRLAPCAGTVLLVASTLFSSWAAPAVAETRFAVVNISGQDAPLVLVEEVEREVQRLRAGSEPIRRDAIHRLLTTGETPAKAVERLLGVAEAARENGACADAIPPAREAETLTLSAVEADEARALLTRIYAIQVTCESELARNEELQTAARRLHALTKERPEQLSQQLWDGHVATVVAPTEKTELLIDSEPANAQIFIDFRNEGTTPRTLEVPRGEVLIEIEKNGFKKAFRRLDLVTPEKRTVFRLIDKRRDRTELVAAGLRVLAKGEPKDRPRVLAQLASWSRADLLVLMRVEEDGRVRIWQFDAERGELAKEVILSDFDPETGSVAALAQKSSAQPATGPAGILSPSAPSSDKDRKPDLTVKPANALTATFDDKPRRRGPPKTRPPWWSYVVAAGLAGLIAALVIADQPSTENDLNINATWEGANVP